MRGLKVVAHNGFTTILLAAGLSRRMGDVNKLLLPIGGKPLIRKVAEVMLAAHSQEVICVLGHEAEKLKDALDGLNLKMVLNADFEAGQMTSVSTGLAAAKKGASAYIIALGDLPRLTSEDCLALMDAHLKAPKGKMTVPVRATNTNEWARGHPIIVPEDIRERILHQEPNLGCRGLINKHPDWVHRFETERTGFFVDLDTPKAFLAEACPFLETSGTLEVSELIKMPG